MRNWLSYGVGLRPGRRPRLPRGRGLSWLRVALQLSQQALDVLLEVGQVVFYGAPDCGNSTSK